MSSIELNGITWDHPRGYEPLVACSVLYEQLFGVRVNWIRRSLKDFGDQSLADLAARFDLLITDYPHAGFAAETRCLFPLDDLLPANTLANLKKDAAGSVFNSHQFGGRPWALPVDAAFQSAAIRPDLFTSAWPMHWEEVFDLAAALRRSGHWIGMALCATDALCSFLSLSAQLGMPMNARKGEGLEQEKTIQVLMLLRRMRDHFHPDCLSWNPIQLYDRMTAQDDIVYSPLAFNYTNYSRSGFRRHLLQFGAPPGGVTVLGGAGIGVSALTGYPQAAANYAAWVCSGEIQRNQYVNASGQPASLSAWLDPGADRLTNFFFSQTLSTLQQAYVRPNYRRWPKFQEWLGETLHHFLVHDQEIGAVARNINENYLASKH